MGKINIMVVLKVSKIIAFEVEHCWALKMAVSRITDAFIADEVCAILGVNLRMKVFLRWMWQLPPHPSEKNNKFDDDQCCCEIYGCSLFTVEIEPWLSLPAARQTIESNHNPTCIYGNYHLASRGGGMSGGKT